MSERSDPLTEICFIVLNYRHVRSESGDAVGHNAEAHKYTAMRRAALEVCGCVSVCWDRRRGA